jgi:hypothetical protein
MNELEPFGKHIRAVEPREAEIDWPDTIYHGVKCFLIGVGTEICERNGVSVGSSDRIVKLADGKVTGFHESRIK